ncbi:crocetin glucosyltransferase 3-like [Setaria italica]|uniref:crocetin glucosyltransferase 3-like n=1 Tax=Setaria italica TaxID=4555 RepID=UPI000BE60492|nr:crocetin glucosyltransferase 3-like [Setaria italica]
MRAIYEALECLFHRYAALLKNAEALRLPEHPDVELHRSQLSPAFLLRGDLSDRWTAFYLRMIRHGYRTGAVLANTVEELEPTGLVMMRRTLDGKVLIWPVGPLVRGDASSETGGGGVLRWLDSQPPSSVLYISFGSQNTIQPNHNKVDRANVARSIISKKSIKFTSRRALLKRDFNEGMKLYHVSGTGTTFGYRKRGTTKELIAEIELTLA